VAIYDLGSNPVYDPEGGDYWATDIQTESMWPKGFGEASFTFYRKRPWHDWPIRESYGVKIFDGSWRVYQGRIETIKRGLSGHSLEVTCAGWWVLFEERLIHKRWVDILGIDHLHWPIGLAYDRVQNSWVHNKRENTLHILAGTDNLDRLLGEMYRELYKLPAGTVYRLVFNWALRTGESLYLDIYNSTTAANEWSVTKINSQRRQVTDQVVVFAGLTNSFEARIRVGGDNEYDQNDYVTMSNLRVEANYEASHPEFASPTYTQAELIKDIVLLLRQQGQQLSADFSRVTGPTTQLYPFELDRPAYAARAVEDLLSYGDVSLRTWGVCVFDDRDASDNLPQVETGYWNIDDHDYLVELSEQELADFQDERLSTDLYNYVIVGYTDSQGTFQYRTPDDNASLKNQASINDDYRRSYYLELGQCTAEQADALGERFLQFHQSRQFGGSFRVIDTIRTRAGGRVPVNRIRAGERVKLINTGETFFIRHVKYDAEGRTATLSPNGPQDNIQMVLARQERERKFNQAPPGTF
jgi:hypothetical protein